MLYLGDEKNQGAIDGYARVPVYKHRINFAAVALKGDRIRGTVEGAPCFVPQSEQCVHAGEQDTTQWVFATVLHYSG